MARYSFEANDTADGTLASGGLLADATTQRRCKIYDWMVGSEATPGDTALLWVIDRGTTGLGTSSAVTPSPLDLADAVSITDADGTGMIVEVGAGPNGVYASVSGYFNDEPSDVRVFSTDNNALMVVDRPEG